MKLIIGLAAAMLLQANGCQQSQPAAAPQPVNHTAHQRFVPVPAPQAGMAGVPWTGYFALDTESGTLCRTVQGVTLRGFQNIPSCLGIFSGGMFGDDSKK